MQNEIPNRKSIRLKGYDYSSDGMYFITICCKERYNYFGEICCRGGALLHPVVELYNIGEIVSEQWYELKNRYQNILLDQFIIMPNHIHGIIVINNEHAKEGAELGSDRGNTPAIGNIICAYKSITTKLSNENESSPGRIIWQRRYHDRIIRNEIELQRTRQYIYDNTVKWQDDEYYNY